MDQLYDVLGIGNAIVDVISRADDDVLAREGLQKGSMALIDEARVERLYSAMGPAISVSGGSAANTIVGVSAFGSKAAFIGKVKADESGRVFSHDIRSTGVHFPTTPADSGPSTARCLVLVTPDGERTMSTYLGACQNLTPDDVDGALVAASGIIYLEGYLWDPPAAKEAFVKAAKIAHEAERKVALSLSDPFCVDRYRDEFLALIRKRVVDIIFANEHEVKALYQTSDFETAISALREDCGLAIITRSERGSMIVSRDETNSVGAHPIENLIDTTGAGDLFAAGFLAGLSRSLDLTTCARLGALAASEVIQHFGARPERNLRQLAEENGLL